MRDFWRQLMRTKTLRKWNEPWMHFSLISVVAVRQITRIGSHVSEENFNSLVTAEKYWVDQKKWELNCSFVFLFVFIVVLKILKIYYLRHAECPGRNHTFFFGPPHTVFTAQLVRASVQRLPMSTCASLCGSYLAAVFSAWSLCAISGVSGSWIPPKFISNRNSFSSKIATSCAF